MSEAAGARAAGTPQRSEDSLAASTDREDTASLDMDAAAAAPAKEKTHSAAAGPRPRQVSPPREGSHTGAGVGEGKDKEDEVAVEEEEEEEEDEGFGEAGSPGVVDVKDLSVQPTTAPAEDPPAIAAAQGEPAPAPGPAEPAAAPGQAVDPPAARSKRSARFQRGSTVGRLSAAAIRFLSPTRSAAAQPPEGAADEVAAEGSEVGRPSLLPTPSFAGVELRSMGDYSQPGGGGGTAAAAEGGGGGGMDAEAVGELQDVALDGEADGSEERARSEAGSEEGWRARVRPLQARLLALRSVFGKRRSAQEVSGVRRGG